MNFVEGKKKRGKMLKGGKWTFDVAGIRNVRLSTLRMTTARVGDS